MLAFGSPAVLFLASGHLSCFSFSFSIQKLTDQKAVGISFAIL